MGTIRNKLLAVIAAGALSVTALASITPFTENPTDLPQANASGSLKSTTEGGGKGAPPSWYGKLAGKWNEWKAQGSAYLEFSDQPDSTILDIGTPLRLPDPGEKPIPPIAPPSGRGNMTVSLGTPTGNPGAPGLCKCTYWSYTTNSKGERVRDKCLDAERSVHIYRHLQAGYYSPDKVKGAAELCRAPGAWMLDDTERGIRKELKGNSIIEAFLAYKFGRMGDRDLHQYFSERYPADFPNRNFKPEVDVQLISVAGAGMTQTPVGREACDYYSPGVNMPFENYIKETESSINNWDGGAYAAADLGGGDGASSWLMLLSRAQSLAHIVNPGENRNEHDQDRQNYRQDAHHRPRRGNQGFPRNQQQQNQRHLGHGL